MTDWRDYDEAWDRAEAYGQDVGDNTYGDWTQSDPVVQDLRQALAHAVEHPLRGGAARDERLPSTVTAGDEAERTAA